MRVTCIFASLLSRLYMLWICLFICMMCALALNAEIQSSILKSSVIAGSSISACNEHAAGQPGRQSDSRTAGQPASQATAMPARQQQPKPRTPYIYIYIYIYMCTYIYIYIYTHTCYCHYHCSSHDDCHHHLQGSGR